MTDVCTMELQLNVNPTQDPNAGRICMEWLRRGVELIGGDLYARLLDAEPLDQSVLRNLSYGAPGSIWAHYVVTNERGRRKAFAFSMENWNVMLEGMGKPTQIELELSELNERGYLESPMSVAVNVRPSYENPDWWFLTALMPGEWLRDQEYENSIIELMGECANLGDPSYGHVTFLYSGGQSPLENSMRKVAAKAIATGREYLRGYSWLTVLNREFVERLGMDSLRNSGAFYSIRELAGGGALLQATEHYSEYGYEVAERIFRPLAPVLPPGEPIFRETADPPRYLAYEDAAKYQQ